MRGARLFIVLTVALLACGCTRRTTPHYAMIDPATGQQIGVLQGAPAVSAPPPMVAPPMRAPAARADGRGLFGAPAAPPPAQPPSYPPQILQVPRGAVYAAAPADPEPYTLDAGDRLRIVVFGQDGISAAYLVDAGGQVTLPLVGPVPARGATPAQLATAIAARLRQGYVRDPKVTVEVETYRPFFILGEVTTPGQYPYSPGMTAETAIAIAGGFGPRAAKTRVRLTRTLPGQMLRGEVPLAFALKPGDTIVVPERWF